MKLTLATDMWSVGCLLYQMLTGELLFTGKSEMQMLNSIFRTFGSPTDGERTSQ
jgi:serine/threonine protein kinase